MIQIQFCTYRIPRTDGQETIQSRNLLFTKVQLLLSIDNLQPSKSSWRNDATASIVFTIQMPPWFSRATWRGERPQTTWEHGTEKTALIEFLPFETWGSQSGEDDVLYVQYIQN